MHYKISHGYGWLLLHPMGPLEKACLRTLSLASHSFLIEGHPMRCSTFPAFLSYTLMDAEHVPCLGTALLKL